MAMTVKKALTLQKKLIADRERVLKSSDKIAKLLLTTDAVIGGYNMIRKLRRQKNLFDSLASVMNERIALFAKENDKNGADASK